MSDSGISRLVQQGLVPSIEYLSQAFPFTWTFSAPFYSVQSLDGANLIASDTFFDTLKTQWVIGLSVAWGLYKADKYYPVTSSYSKEMLMSGIVQ